MWMWAVWVDGMGGVGGVVLVGGLERLGEGEGIGPFASHRLRGSGSRACSCSPARGCSFRSVDPCRLTGYRGSFQSSRGPLTSRS